MKQTPSKLKIKKWIDPDTTGFIYIDGQESLFIANKRTDKNDDRIGKINSLDLNVKIADCSRSVTLDFYMYDKKEIKPKIKKIGILISALQRVEKMLQESLEKEWVK